MKNEINEGLSDYEVKKLAYAKVQSLTQNEINELEKKAKALNKIHSTASFAGSAFAVLGGAACVMALMPRVSQGLADGNYVNAALIGVGTTVAVAIVSLVAQVMSYTEVEKTENKLTRAKNAVSTISSLREKLSQSTEATTKYAI